MVDQGENMAVVGGTPDLGALGRRRPGRPEVLSLEIAERICRRVAKGVSVRRACQAEGVDDGTFDSRVIQDKTGEFQGIYARARVEFEERMIDRMLADPHGGRAEQFILERRYEWRKPPEVAVQVNQSVNASGDSEEPGPEEIARVIRKLAQDQIKAAARTEDGGN
jgi:hypothetical protein